MLKTFIAAVSIAIAAACFVPTAVSVMPIVQTQAATETKSVTFQGIKWKIPKRFKYDARATDDVTLGMKQLKSKAYSVKTSTDKNGLKTLLMPPQTIQFDIVDSVASEEGFESLGYDTSHVKVAGKKAVKCSRYVERDDGGTTKEVKVSFKKGRKYYVITAENVKEINTILKTAKAVKKHK